MSALFFSIKRLLQVYSRFELPINYDGATKLNVYAYCFRASPFNQVINLVYLFTNKANSPLSSDSSVKIFWKRDHQNVDHFEKAIFYLDLKY